MDQTHTRALEALQPFIHLARSNSAGSPRFIANLITNATSSPQTYVFAELLELPTVQALRSPDTPAEFKGYLKLLEIFAWGTWQEYQTTPNLPELNTEQTLKLRLLSLLTLSTTIKPLTYSALMTALSTPTKAELESLVTKAIYASLITARLSPASNPPSVNVTAVAPLRDVQPKSLPQMIANLSEWESRCGEVVSDLEAEIARVKSDAAKRAARAQAHNEALEEAVKRKQSTGKKGGRRGGRPGAGVGGSKRDADDIDEDDGYFDTYDGGENASRMDIDEAPGARAGNSRQPKRVLGRKS
ncbi:Proteasome component (PCI) domain [Penicillium camemberti]|uniref:Proteasome component (PCI) domain n=1 Tax=Penicillium camemberti (strain FM 013) TaxID=1429867 RepID=A0A0G4PWF0_PENC3|nr:Proteasome component (PCI) domain [Penicillium camemberti]